MRRLLLLLVLCALTAPVVAQTTTDVYTPPHWATEEVLASIAVPRLNVRAAPSLDAHVATIVRLGERYRIVDEEENDDGRWLLIQIGGSHGWVFADLVIITNPEDLVDDDSVDPAIIANVNRQVEAGRNTLAVVDNLNIRSAPHGRASIVGRVPYDGRVYPIGRNYFGSWIKVNYNGVVGWVSVLYIVPPPNYNVFGLPIVQ